MLSKARFTTLIPIRDMNRALRFYTKSLGAKLVYRGRGDMKNSWASIKLAGHDIWLVAPGKTEKRKLAYSLLLVSNIKLAVKQLQAKKVKFERAEKMGEESRIEGPITFEPFGASAFFKDSEGNLMMVWQNVPPM
jgi:predicted enzyme related to lactoylglutathione lyase